MQETPFEDFHIPIGVLEYVRNIFGSVNDHVSQKFSKIPNIKEESLDISFIDRLSDFSEPVVVCPDWAVQVAAHFIGSIRHHRRYEIADIGVVVVFKRTSRIVGRKLVLLQSKRLYPNNYRVNEFEDFDYELGLGIAIRDNQNEATIMSTVTYEFDENSKYGALLKSSNQCNAINEHFGETKIPVHYMLYNPLIVPCAIEHPIKVMNDRLPNRQFGTRVIDASDVHDAMDGLPDNAPLALKKLAGACSSEGLAFGRTLEDFFYEVVSCRNGYQFHSIDDGIRRLFRRKSGPIFCVIELTIEQSLPEPE